MQRMIMRRKKEKLKKRKGNGDVICAGRRKRKTRIKRERKPLRQPRKGSFRKKPSTGEIKE